ncbi:hypothetical protein BJV82DRAFT_690497 [Fennellomyces sp. T-0311]|nr:hypothetical protein BJV82DRAFT_690497 [Fennellomyces sp. T-0311]
MENIDKNIKTTTNKSKTSGRPPGGKNPPNSKRVGRLKKKEPVDHAQAKLLGFGFTTPRASSSSTEDLVDADRVISDSNVQNPANDLSEPAEEQSNASVTQSEYVSLAELLLSNEQEAEDTEPVIREDINPIEEEADDLKLSAEDRADREQKESILRAYFEEIQERIKVKDGDEPREYRAGKFWVEPKDPFFALRDGLDPSKLYQPRVFLWFPHLLVKKIKPLKCPTCQSSYSVKGYTKEPHARRIVDLDSRF